jgi:hypothetical protein
MKDEAMLALAKELAKNLKTEADLNDFSRALKKLTVETVEQVHRELKQTKGIERCQCRKGQSQRNHIACCILVWHRFIALARECPDEKSKIYP